MLIVLMGIVFIVCGVVAIALADRITDAMQRSASSIGLPRSLYRAIFVKFFGWVVFATGVLAVIIFGIGSA